MVTISSKPKKIKTETDVLKILSIVFVVLAHLAMGLFVFWSYRYFAISKTIFISLLGALVVLFIIIDIVLIIGVNFKDKILKIIPTVLAALLFIVGSVGSYYIYKVNSNIDKIIDNKEVDQYETVSVTFVSYKDTYDSLKDIAGKKVGIIYSTAEGTGSFAQDELAAEGIEVDIISYSSQDDLFYDLISESVDVAVFPTAYRSKYLNDENIDYSDYLNECHDFYSFEKKVKVGENSSTKKDLTTEPFNVLLIGYAPEDSGYGLSDAIILASINPKSMSVSMTSIARDSYVEISCYGGNKDKINASRGVSRQCLMDTVSNLLDVDIDFYMEVNFKGLAAIVDAVGGIQINSPVEFVGQNTDTERGNYTVWIPKGYYWANGEEALAFARERHAMPNGDFDRQKHQKEVIIEISKALIGLRDVNKALDVLEAAGDNFSTNISLNQLTRVFNYIISAPNYVGVDQFSLIQIDSGRLIGYADYYYNYNVQLPLWIYRLFNGSIEEAKEIANMTLGDVDNIEQPKFFSFWYEWLYGGRTLYSTWFNEPQVHSQMPYYVLKFTNYKYEEMLAWAAESGARLDVTFIPDTSPDYVASQDGYVVSYSPRYGSLIEAGDTVSITVMGQPVPEEYKVPNFVGQDYQTAVAWSRRTGVQLQLTLLESNQSEYNSYLKQFGGAYEQGQVYTQGVKAGSDYRYLENNTLQINALEYRRIDLNDTGLTPLVSTRDQVLQWVSTNLLTEPSYVYILSSDVPDGTFYSIRTDDTKTTSASKYIITLTAVGVDVESLIGKTQDEVIAYMNTLGIMDTTDRIVVGVMAEDPSYDGLVYEQSAAGLVARSEAMNLTVSVYAPFVPVTVPDIPNDLEGAKAALVAAEFTYEVVETETSDSSLNGTIESMSPGSGSTVRADRKHVVLTVYKYVEPAGGGGGEPEGGGGE